MQFHPTTTRTGKVVHYPSLQPLAAGAAEIDGYLKLTSLGRHALKLRADAAGSRPEPVVPDGMDREERDELLGQSHLGRALLRRERQP